MLLGLSPSMYGWDLQEFVESCQLNSEEDVMLALQLLAVEYDDDGTNEKFRSLMQGSVCTIGSASKTTQLMYRKLGLGMVPLGGYVGKLDCHIGGTPGSCSERAALIRYKPTEITTDLRALLRGVLGDHLQIATKALDTEVFPGSAGVRPVALLKG